MQATFTDEIAAVRQAVAEKVGQQKYSVWFKNNTTFELVENILRVGVPSNFIGSWIENNFLEDISFAVRKVTGGDKKIIFSIESQLAEKIKGSQFDSEAQQAGTEQQKNAEYVPARVVQPFGPALKMNLDTFVVGPKNQLAYNAAKSIVGQEKSPFNPLFFHGGYGVGKTHLLQGICNHVRKTKPQARWLYVSAEEFTNQYVLALKTRKLEAFRNKFRQMDLLAIDDIHFLANKNAMQAEFLHTFNTIDLAGRQVILASDAHPKMIGQLAESLVNRFVSGMVVKIEPPDFETRCRICTQRASEMKKQFPQNTVEYIAEKMTSNIRELEGAMLKVVAYASLSNEKITLEMAKQVLADHISRTDPVVHSSDITSAVTAFFGISAAEINSSKKDRTVSLARAFCMYLTRKHTKMSYPEIGRLMGNKNHATVILACRKVEDLLKRNVDITWTGSSGNRISKPKNILNQLMESISV